jgi:hypothetical protein
VDRWRRRIREAPRCGELDGGLDGAIVWLACDCGAAVIQCQEGSEAELLALICAERTREARRFQSSSAPRALLSTQRQQRELEP